MANVLNMEGVNGLENMKWSDLDTFDIIQYDVTMPLSPSDSLVRWIIRKAR